METLRSGIFYERRVDLRRHADTTAHSGPPLRAPSKAQTASDNLPRLQVSATVNVVSTTSRTILTQLFWNDTNETIECSSYCFPLYDGSVITSFQCWIGPDTIKGVVKSKDDARREFQQAIAHQRAASLLEEQTPEVFEMALGNIPPQVDVKVEIIYLTELKADLSGDGVIVTIPTSIAPRYGNEPDSYRGGTVSTARMTQETGMKIQINVSAHVPIRALEGRSHPLSVELGSTGAPTPAVSFRELLNSKPEMTSNHNHARAILSDRKGVLEKDFVLAILVGPSTLLGIPNLLAPRAVRETCQSHPGYSAIKVSFIPRDLFTPQMKAPGFKTEVLILADRSGSMEPKMESLRRALRLLLSKLPDDCFFNVCSFGSSLHTLWTKSQALTQDARGCVQRHYSESFEANLGGTEILSALQSTVNIRRRDKNLITQIIVLTDGEVWNVQSIIDYVRSTRNEDDKNLRFFALGIGDEVSHQMIEGIGKHGGGFSEVISVYSGASWDDRIFRMVHGILTPSSWKCQVSLKDRNGDVIRSFGSTTMNARPQNFIVRSPHLVSSQHGFSRAIFYFLVQDTACSFDEIEIEGNSASCPGSKVSLPIEDVVALEPMILYLASKSVLGDFETGQSWMHDLRDSIYKGDDLRLKREVILEAQRIGVYWGITGKWTSFVGVHSTNHSELPSQTYQADRIELSELMK
ncbi:von Willebrand factor type A domain-domain-containing protein, partial [Clohesyomyces aquaticus]